MYPYITYVKKGGRLKFSPKFREVVPFHRIQPVSVSYFVPRIEEEDKCASALDKLYKFLILTILNAKYRGFRRRDRWLDVCFCHHPFCPNAESEILGPFFSSTDWVAIFCFVLSDYKLRSILFYFILFFFCCVFSRCTSRPAVRFSNPTMEINTHMGPKWQGSRTLSFEEVNKSE